MAEYIDKEQVIEWFRPYGHMDKGIPYYGLVTDVREMKVADVAPVKHGRWEWNAKGLYPKPLCSKCHYEPYRRSNCNSDLPNYCPNCGARMDGDKE